MFLSNMAADRPRVCPSVAPSLWPPVSPSWSSQDIYEPHFRKQNRLKVQLVPDFSVTLWWKPQSRNRKCCFQVKEGVSSSYKDPHKPQPLSGAAWGRTGLQKETVKQRDKRHVWYQSDVSWTFRVSDAQHKGQKYLQLKTWNTSLKCCLSQNFH